jgi:hypothetical protein
VLPKYRGTRHVSLKEVIVMHSSIQEDTLYLGLEKSRKGRRALPVEETGW